MARTVRLHLFGEATLLRASGPGLPGSTEPEPYFIRRAREGGWLGAIIDLDPAAGGVAEWGANGATMVREGGRVEVTITPTRASISHPGGKVALAGLRDTRVIPPPLISERPAWEARTLAPHAWTAPALDATLEGFDLDHPLSLDGEHQYRRSEEPYDAERFSATAWVNWDQQGIYMAVEVRKPEMVLRSADAPPLELDNEADDIHQDGLQIYLRYPDGETAGFVVLPDESGVLRSRPVGREIGTSVEGVWAETDEGYSATLALRDPRLASFRPGETLGLRSRDQRDDERAGAPAGPAGLVGRWGLDLSPGRPRRGDRGPLSWARAEPTDAKSKGQQSTGKPVRRKAHHAFIAVAAPAGCRCAAPRRSTGSPTSFFRAERSSRWTPRRRGRLRSR